MRTISFTLCFSIAIATAQTDWPDPGHDKTNQRYSSLNQINTSNVATLRPVWNFPIKKEGNFLNFGQSVPVVINGIMYVSRPYCHVAALDPESGKQLWTYTAKKCDFRGNGLSSMRSVAYWPGDQQREPRILFGTEDGELIALNAKTGAQSPGFGNEGIVNLKTPEIMNGYPSMHYGLTSAPFVFDNLVITGSHIVDEAGLKGPSGDVRAWDVRTGKLVWTFHTVKDAEKGISGANAWSFFTADRQLGTLFVGLGSFNNDYYGTDRPGNNLYANSLVALDIRSGKLKWHFQAIHHDIWDYDMPVPPMLFDVVQQGRKIPAVGAMTKNPLFFILDRRTGKPIYGVEEKPVAKGDVPGEWYSPTQPFPVKPPPLSRQSFTTNDFAKISPEHEKACRDWYSEFLTRGGTPNKGPYTPASATGALRFPTVNGGSWLWGGSFDPTLGYYIINTSDTGGLVFIRNEKRPPLAYADPEGVSPILMARQAPPLPAASQTPAFAAYSFTSQGLPCWAPPWGRLTAIDVNTGDIAWQIPYGIMDGVPEGIKTGAPNSQGGPTTTAGGLTFVAGTRDRYLRAIESKTGKELWSFRLEQMAVSVPITYLGKSGKQYLAIVAGEQLVTFALGASTTAPPQTSTASTSSSLPDGAGKQVVQRVCSPCHGPEVVAGRRQNRAEWTDLVQRMAQMGASATDTEFRTIVDYLTEHFGNR